MNDRERRDQDIDDCLRRADELIDEAPWLTVEAILTVLDDEFAGSMIWPSEMGTVRSYVTVIVHDALNREVRLIAVASASSPEPEGR